MSPKRMSEILSMHGIEPKPGKPEKYMNIMKAMLQCNNEAFEEGKSSLGSLVQAQKELIDWYTVNVELYPSAAKKVEPIYSKIKQLES